jgi:hypothetical protein
VGSPSHSRRVASVGIQDIRTHRFALLRRLKRRPDANKTKHWQAFLNNHREVIAAFDFFTVPSLAFRTLYCFFVIEHGRLSFVIADMFYSITTLSSAVKY